MHPFPVFQADTDDALSFVDAHPFAVLATNGPEGPISALAPLVLERDNEGIARRLVGHVARHNPFWRLAEEKPVGAIAVFKGADAYVSASAYPSKKAHGKVVPTWNYIAVQVRGMLTLESDTGKLRPVLEALTDKMEYDRQEPWTVDDAQSDYIERLSRSIIGFYLTLDDVTHVRKLSQNKSADDKTGVRQDLLQSPDAQAQIIAQEISNEGSRI
jgi:transcriptional regulator